jgi:hypothetical protein
LGPAATSTERTGISVQCMRDRQNAVAAQTRGGIAGQ